jgi:hypothetical protein
MDVVEYPQCVHNPTPDRFTALTARNGFCIG